MDDYVIVHINEKPCRKNDTLRKILLARQLKSKEWAKSDWHCLVLIYIYSNSNLLSLVRTRIFTVDTSRLKPKRNRLKVQTLKSPSTFLLIKILCHPEYLRVYSLWYNHQKHFKMVHSCHKRQKLEFVSLKCVSYTQPIWVPLNESEDSLINYLLT